MDKSWFEKQKIVEERKQRYSKNKSLADKTRIKEDVRKKLMTTMIGALDAFEKQFGELWGWEKQYEDLTDTELEFNNKWEQARSDILDNGHSQISAILNELDSYNIEWNGYQTNFTIKD